MNSLPQDEIATLILIAEQCWQRGWSRAGSCGFSVLDPVDPQQLWMTSSGRSRNQLSTNDFAQLDLGDSVSKSDACSSMDHLLHAWVAKRHAVANQSLAIIQTQSVWSGLLANRFATLDGILLEDHSLLQQLSSKPAASFWLPIALYAPEPQEQLLQLDKTLQFTPDNCHRASALIVQNNCLLTWAETPEAAFRQAEVFEFFCEQIVRRATLG